MEEIAFILIWVVGATIGAVILMAVIGLGLDALAARRRNLGALIDSVHLASARSMPMVDTLRVVADDASGPTDVVFRMLLNRVMTQVVDGFPLGGAFRQEGRYFPETLCSMLDTGERYGNLRLFSAHLKDIFAEGMAFRETAACALFYPTLVWWTMATAFTGMSVYMLRNFREVLEDTGTTLPAASAFLLNYGSWLLFVPAVAMTFLIVFILFVAPMRGMAARRIPFLRRTGDRMALRLPFMRRLTESVSYARFAHSLGALLSCGMPLDEAVGVSLDTDINTVIRKRLEKVHRALREGRRLGASLRAEGAPEEVCWFAETGEDTGALAGSMLRLAELYRTHVRTAARISPKVLVPLATIPAGIAVGFYMVAWWLPLLNVMEAL